MVYFPGLAPPPHQEIDQQHWYAQLIAAIRGISVDMVVRGAGGTDYSGPQISMWKALDAEAGPHIIPRAPYNVGSISGSTALDLANGGTQRASLTADATISGISNFDEGAWMNLRFETNGFTLTFSGTAFEGPVLSFTETTVWLSVVDFGTAKLAVMGGGI